MGCQCMGGISKSPLLLLSLTQRAQRESFFRASIPTTRLFDNSKMHTGCERAADYSRTEVHL